ncbi:MAG: UvrD-helicase domain-containing protein [Verrucomicrobiae bacterium]|nr:UvrD-helicase domain-containing protein [Verrucomicrobiae bacterium]
MPSDNSARHRFETEIHRNFCIAAGAGTGKTTSIVRRICHLATHTSTHSNQDDPLSRLVVVTYGKLAAEKLKIRTQNLLIEQLTANSELHPLLNRLKKAYFGTIHSFCLKLLTQEGHHLGLPSDLDLIDDSAELWTTFCESQELKELQLPEEPLNKFLRHFTFETLLQIASKIKPADARKRLQKQISFSLPVLHFTPDQPLKGRGAESTAKNQTHLMKWLDAFHANQKFLEIPFYDKGSKFFKDQAQHTFYPYLNALSEIALFLASHVALAYQTFRVKERKITYDDQIQWCHQLLQSPESLERLRARRYIILLDEAQDTDSDMFSILVELARPAKSLPFQWPQNLQAPPPESGRFSFVGDNQQTIYSNRADVATYTRYTQAYENQPDSECLEFSVTQRCPQHIVQTVNHVFPHRLTQSHVQFRELIHKPTSHPGFSIALHFTSTTTPSLETKEAFISECHGVAQWLTKHPLQQLLKSASWNWNDVAVLCPRIEWLEQARQIFDLYQLPTVSLSQKQPAFLTPALSWPTMLLYTLFHPYDRFELLGVLREIFVISDIELAQAHLQLSEGLNLYSQTPHHPKLQAALTFLQNLKEICSSETLPLSLSQKVQQVFEQTQLADRLQAIDESLESLEYILNQACMAEIQGVSFLSFVKQLTEQLKNPAPLFSTPNDAIQFLTSMKAKGLEWPIVIALGMNRRIYHAPETYPKIKRHPETQELKIQVHPYQKDCDDEAITKKAQREELQRLLYVTFTRAKKVLIVPQAQALYANETDFTFSNLVDWEALPANTFSQIIEIDACLK